MSSIRSLILTAMLFLPLLSIGQTDPKWLPEMTTVISDRITKGLFVDGVIGVVSKQSISPETAAFGHASLDTIFEIGSITKSFTGILFAQLVLENAVSTTDTVEKFAPELSGTFVGQIQLAELATHTSGLSRIPDDIPNTLNPYSIYTWEQLLNYLKITKPITVSKPYPLKYSNTGFALLGKILEIVTKETYSDLLQKRIFNPLKMADSFLSVPIDKQNRFIDGHWSDLTVTPHWDWLAFAPTGGIRSTAFDMIKYIKANLNLDDSSLGKAMELSQKNNWGWDSQSLNLPFPYKNGATYGFNSAMFVDHTRQAAAIVLTNIYYEADSLTIPILKANNN